MSYDLSSKEQGVFRKSLRKSVKIIHKAEPMTDTNKALEAFNELVKLQKIKADAYDKSNITLHDSTKWKIEVLFAKFLKEHADTVTRALSPNAVVIPREEFEEVVAFLESAEDKWRVAMFNTANALVKQALAILSQYGERK